MILINELSVWFILINNWPALSHKRKKNQIQYILVLIFNLLDHIQFHITTPFMQRYTRSGGKR